MKILINSYIVIYVGDYMKFKLLFEDYDIKDSDKAIEDAESKFRQFKSVITQRLAFSAYQEDNYHEERDRVYNAVKDLEKACKKDDFESIKENLVSIAIWEGSYVGESNKTQITPTEQEFLAELDHPAEFAWALSKLCWNAKPKKEAKRDAYELFSKWCQNRGGGVKGFFKKFFGTKIR